MPADDREHKRREEANRRVEDHREEHGRESNGHDVQMGPRDAHHDGEERYDGDERDRNEEHVALIVPDLAAD